MEKKEIIDSIVKNGGIVVKNLGVKNVTITPQESYLRVALTLDRAVKGMVSKDGGVTYEEGETNVIFVSAFSIASILKENDDASFAVNHILQHPESLSVILSRAKINIIQQHVVAGEEYTNPWSSNADKKAVFQHDTIINHLTDIELSEFSVRKLDRLADGMLGL